MKPTEARQPIVYDLMILIYCLIELKQLKNIKPKESKFCERQIYLETALTKIRGLSQFISGKGEDLLKITDPEFKGASDNKFIKGLFVRVSKYVSHLDQQRYKKDIKYKSLSANETLQVGKEIIEKIKPLIDAHKATLKGDAKHWYAVFEKNYIKFNS